MQFKSVRTQVTLLVGGCILLVVAALVGYSMYASSRSQALVDASTRDLLEKNIAKRLDAIAADQTARIDAKLTHALTLARNLASLNTMMASPKGGGAAPLTLSRDELSNVVRQTVIGNPDLLDAFIGWEPNAFGHDALYTGREDQGYGPDGRFMPWWYRTQDGDLKVLPLGSDMENRRATIRGFARGNITSVPRSRSRSASSTPTPTTTTARR